MPPPPLKPARGGRATSATEHHLWAINKLHPVIPGAFDIQFRIFNRVCHLPYCARHKAPPLPAGTCILIFLKKGFVQSAANREQKGWSRPRGRVPLWFYLGLIPMTLFKATPEPQIIGFCKVLWGQHGVILHETDPFRLSLSIVRAFKMKLNGLKSCPTLIRGADKRNLFYVESSFSVSPLLSSSEPDPVIKVHSISSIIYCTFFYHNFDRSYRL